MSIAPSSSTWVLEGDHAGGKQQGRRIAVSLEFQLVKESTLDSCSKDGIDSEQEEMVVNSSSIGSLCISIGRWFVSMAQSLADILSKLEEEEEPEESGVGRDILSIEYDESFVGDEHLGEFFVDCWSFSMLYR